MEEEKLQTKELNLAEIEKQLNRLRKKIKSYEFLAETVRAAMVIDPSIYLGEANSDWLSIDRDDYVQIMEALSRLDLWKPWQRSF